MVMQPIGDKMLPHRIVIPAISHAAELERIIRLIAADDALFNGETTPRRTGG